MNLLETSRSTRKTFVLSHAEPAAADVRFVSGPTGWLRLVAPASANSSYWKTLWVRLKIPCQQFRFVWLRSAKLAVKILDRLGSIVFFAPRTFGFTAQEVTLSNDPRMSRGAAAALFGALLI
jgi:hypothetical protein